ncbi:hypothetical protein GCM10011576_40200 [Micromonospora parathelypteridis]|uniref:Uncharacterized protein n=1 Tax=Micromonospora parathelypteridis TaxID=1839617 RepID=A0A840VU88_9ACTN|nr:hypothetical protein [Micromonospora parathelypteridis]GGO21651.1 hypothetical protein GCM10011576_40200 [Micromonospora parathelypteridis]
MYGSLRNPPRWMCDSQDSETSAVSGVSLVPTPTPHFRKTVATLIAQETCPPRTRTSWTSSSDSVPIARGGDVPHTPGTHGRTGMTNLVAGAGLWEVFGERSTTP